MGYTVVAAIDDVAIHGMGGSVAQLAVNESSVSRASSARELRYTMWVPYSNVQPRCNQAAIRPA